MSPAIKLWLIVMGAGAVMVGGIILYRDSQKPADVIVAVCRDGTRIYLKPDGTHRLQNGAAVVGPEACK